MTTRHCYLFAGGGTGGHLTPGLAVAAALLKAECDCRIVFAGSDRALEHNLVAAAGYDHHAMPVESSRALRRNPLRFAWKNVAALRIASRLVQRESPRAVIGLGGFASVPLVYAALRRAIPTLILEQNAVPGRATRLFSRRVGAVCIAFDQAREHLSRSAHIVTTGNPVRESIAALCRPDAGIAQSGAPILLVLGGSQGAEGLNAAVVDWLASRPGALEGWQVVHQTGEAQYAQVATAYRDLGGPHVVQPFFDDLAAWYSRATLAVSRAGGTTLAELACAGCPAVLLPYPHATHKHQHANARAFEAAGGAVIVEQDRTAAGTLGRLAQPVTELIRNPERLSAMRMSMLRLARPRAAAEVCEVLQTVVVRSMR